MDNGAIFVKKSVVKNAIFILVYWLCCCVMLNRITRPGVSEAILIFGIFSLVLLVFIVVLSDIRYKRTKLFYEDLFISEVVDDELKIRLTIGEILVKKADIDKCVVDVVKGGLIVRIPQFNWLFGLLNDSGELKVKKRLFRTFKKGVGSNKLKVADAVIKLDSSSRKEVLLPSVLCILTISAYVVIDILMKGQFGRGSFGELILPYILPLFGGIFLSFFLYAGLLKEVVDYKRGLSLPNDLGEVYLYQMDQCEVRLNKSDVVLEFDDSSEILTTTIKGFKYISQVSKSEYEDFVGISE